MSEAVYIDCIIIILTHRVINHSFSKKKIHNMFTIAFQERYNVAC